MCVQQDRSGRSKKSAVMQKLDQVLAAHKTAEVDNAARWKTMMNMWERQHSERLTMLKHFIEKLN